MLFADDEPMSNPASLRTTETNQEEIVMTKVLIVMPVILKARKKSMSVTMRLKSGSSTITNQRALVITIQKLVIKKIPQIYFLLLQERESYQQTY